MRIRQYIDQYRNYIIAAACLLVIVSCFFLLLSSLLIAPYKKYILNPKDKISMSQEHATVGLVLGAGITKQGKPFRELQARLDVAAESLQKGYIDKLVLSGDNRFVHYDEPKAMQDYLVNMKHVPKNKLQVDDAGRSTYESCERTVKIFGIHEVIIFSAPSHLPRAIYLCRHFGVTTYGIASSIDTHNSGRRELLARAKAVFNVYIYGEKTILGDSIEF